MPKTLKAVVAGGTGLVGGFMLEELRARGVETTVIGRDGLRGPLPAAELAFCSLGTTMKKAGSEAAFRAVDFDLTLAFAKAAREAGARGFGLVSSAGASSRSPFLYLRVKGEVEEAVRALGFPALVVSRPGLLLGSRRESRPAERLGQALAPLLGLLLPRAYRPVEAREVARALVADTILRSGETPGPLDRNRPTIG